MLIITVLVPEGLNDESLQYLRRTIKDALEKEGTPKNTVTVEFPICKSPERIVINYDSRSRHLVETKGRLDHEAEIVGRVVEKTLGIIPVECIVRYCDKILTGLYLTK